MPDDDQVHELDEGELVTTPPHSGMHGLIGGRITRLLHRYLDDHEIGRLLPSGFVLRRDPDVVRSPDVAFLTTERVKEIPEEGFVEGAPDLAVEIVSPSDSATALDRKVRQYLEAGAHAVWVVHRKTREVRVYEAGGRTRVLTANQTLEAPEVLPGFSAKVEDLCPR